MGKLSVFLFLMCILVNICRSQIIIDSPTTNSPPQELNWDAVVTENVNEESTTIADVGETLTSEPLPELETTIAVNENESANTDDDANNTETSNNESVIETQTETNEKPSNNENILPNVPVEESSTNSDNIETTSEINVELEASTESDSDSKTTNIPTAPICSTPGVQAHESDCHQYYDCSLAESLDGNLHLTAKSCPEKQAFNVELNRCSRDISSCSLGIHCASKGSMPDPASNSSYYLCDPRLDGQGFRIFHVHCASYEIYYPLFGRCYIDTSNLGPINWELVKDINTVKAELKQLKKQDKLKLKQKMDQKKKLEKEAKKKAKEEEKINKIKAKQEAASFACVEEGNFASQIADNFYISCINKKNILKAIPMKCNFGVPFNPESGSCQIKSASYNNGAGDTDNSASDEDDDN